MEKIWRPLNLNELTPMIFNVWVNSLRPGGLQISLTQLEENTD